MSRGITDFQKRYHGKTIEHDFKEIQRCQHCGRIMKIQARSKPHHVAGKEENYDIIKVYRRCGSRICPGYLEKPIAPPDTIALTGSDIDLDVQTDICELRFKSNRTAKEHDVPIIIHGVKSKQGGCSIPHALFWGGRQKPIYNVKKKIDDNSIRHC